MESNGKIIAIFDYDGTLAAHDSFSPFIVSVAGMPRLILALAVTFVEMIFQKPEKAERRSFVKETLIRKLLAGKRESDLGPAIEKVKRWSRELDTAKTLREHYAKGHHVVIASGSLSVYLPHLLRELPHHKLICTQVEVKDGVITGNTPGGNCVRARKAAIIADYIKAHGPFDDSYGYGNKPHDLPMLALVNHKTVI